MNKGCHYFTYHEVMFLEWWDNPITITIMSTSRTLIAGGQQSVGELTTKDTGKTHILMPSVPTPLTHLWFLSNLVLACTATSAWNGLSLPLLSLPNPYLLTQSSATAPAESSLGPMPPSWIRIPLLCSHRNTVLIRIRVQKLLYYPQVRSGMKGCS